MPKKSKYDNDLYSAWNWGEAPTSQLAIHSVYNYMNDRPGVFIIHGKPRIGKSAFSFKVAMQVYNFLFGWCDMNRIYDNCMGWLPYDVFKYWRSIKRKSCIDPRMRVDKNPFYICDDWGIWLFSQDWNKKEQKNIVKYFQLVFTKVQNICITSPSVKNINARARSQDLGAVWLEVQYRTGSIGLKELPPSEKYSRVVKAYSPWNYPDQKYGGVWGEYGDHFDCRFPDEIYYNRYKPEREGYTELLEDQIMEDFERDKDRIKNDFMDKIEREIDYNLNENMLIEI